MDFELSEAQQVIAASAADVLKGAADGGSAWSALASAGLLALTLPGWLDGDDLGVLDAAVLLTEVGRAAAACPRARHDHARGAASCPMGFQGPARTACWLESGLASRS